ncbi:hypothetical protein KCP75_12235 [Salmonella enterica subsp. enterica]|nr:hypothetical protein KCP75_12235 [Salmonella enterica subsp. enterica]
MARAAQALNQRLLKCVLTVRRESWRKSTLIFDVWQRLITVGYEVKPRIFDYLHCLMALCVSEPTKS